MTPTDLKDLFSRKRKRQDLDENEFQERRPDSIPVGLPRTYFPASCEHEFGPLPIPPSSNRGKTAFPHNIFFRTANWTTTPIPEDAEGYDVVIAYAPSLFSLSFYSLTTILLIRFSVSKWIHLNSGDKGLKQFFHRVYSVLNSGGTFVLEPQPWDSYAQSRRIDPVRYPSFLDHVGCTLNIFSHLSILTEAQRKLQNASNTA